MEHPKVVLSHFRDTFCCKNVVSQFTEFHKFSWRSLETVEERLAWIVAINY